MNQWLSVLTLLGVGSILGTVVAGLFNKRKLSADATKIITEAAGGLVKDLRDENSRHLAANLVLTERVSALERRERERDVRERERDHAILLHGYWDQQVFTMARDQGLALPEPPPLPT
jgi:hypothetical protein